MAKKTATRAKRVAHRDWSAQDERELRKHSKTKMPVIKISKALKRNPRIVRMISRLGPPVTLLRPLSMADRDTEIARLLS